ncbi:MAG: threonylcarbamoyl-AMP synthase [Spirochaetes bacterium GWF1_31_7]|nr:MAG: threonylcarbamoyl-AMP synthase [Spirochaetes bacterium GWE1_32_154]OHD48807.1 MAG: threonylcarbamoyl-AMP synthase [Spirochaetes bacterium GWE2_31_10]OHD52869.1 MAG: threonylcarbamoyl-AMP synthase [Spirochaetes bacterium GWF1_31_7]OHD82061.1 MAG: threonylcarbamoyl-AMP synthase [Spirochaetes bacterium RIFOXYB1_FULL_32_8]HBD94679.1 threonylcarbamoyl-AMP synthase [Spirochaetia bacterium]
MVLFQNPTVDDIKKAALIIQNGGLVSFPTETVYGLGADVFNTTAIAKVFQVKKRPHFDPLICHVSTIETVEKLAFIPNSDLFNTLTKAFWPGPLTIILPKKDIVPDLITGGLDTVAIRMPDNDIALKLIEYSTGAIAAPSANPFGYISPTRASHVIDTIGKNIDAIIDGGNATFGIESTVIDISTPIPQILRYGSLAIEDIESVLGCSLEYYSNINKLKFKSPGQIKKHYSPTKPLFRFSHPDELQGIDLSDAGVLYFNKKYSELSFKETFFLSESGNLIEAASKLFDILHDMEESDIKTIYAISVPETGLGRAIEDRLNRASTR